MVNVAAFLETAVTAIAVVLFSSPAAAAFTPSHVCARGAPTQSSLDLNATTIGVGYRTWGLVYLNETIAFAAVNLSISVLDTSQFTPTQIASIPFPSEYAMGNDDYYREGYGYRALTLTNDKENLYVATGYGAVIFDVQRTIMGSPNSIVGVLSMNGLVGRSAIELSITPDDQFVFISQEFGALNTTKGRGAIEVYNVTRLPDRQVNSTWRGYIALGFATIGQQFSSDYTKLFVTSEMNTTATSLNQTTGVISVLDVATLKRDPAQSLISKVNSGCHPVRSQMSTDGKTLWVSLREANQMLGFDAVKLANNITTDVLLATVNTGTSPIGLTAVGDYILTADSNRFNYTNTSSGVTVVSYPDAIYKGQVDFPQIPAGAFPRALAVSPSGNTLLISQFEEETLRTVDISSLKRSANATTSANRARGTYTRLKV